MMLLYLASQALCCQRAKIAHNHGKGYHFSTVVVDGEVNGDLYGSECVSIRANAQVECNVVAARVSLEEGARFKGSIDMDPERVKDSLGKKLGSRERASDSAGKPRSTPAAALNSRAAEPGAAQRTGSAKSSKAEPAH